MTDKKASSSVENRDEGDATAYPDLRTIREAKGFSLRNIYEQTRISVANLEAIENGQFHRLPAPVYVRTFIKTYARLIGTDSQVLLDAYEKYLQSLDETERQRKGDRNAARANEQPAYNGMIWVLSAVLTIVVVVVIGYFHDGMNPRVSNLQQPVAVQDSPQSNPTGTTTLPASPTPPQASPEAEKTVQPPPSSETLQGHSNKTASPVYIPGIQPANQEPAADGRYHLAIEAREDVWLRIKGDNNKPEQMIMKAGDKLERFASTSFSVDVGNAGGIDIRFQGNPMGSIGKRGEVVHLRLP